MSGWVVQESVSLWGRLIYMLKLRLIYLEIQTGHILLPMIPSILKKKKDSKCTISKLTKWKKCFFPLSAFCYTVFAIIVTLRYLWWAQYKPFFKKRGGLLICFPIVILFLFSFLRWLWNVTSVSKIPDNSLYVAMIVIIVSFFGSNYAVFFFLVSC